MTTSNTEIIRMSEYLCKLLRAELGRVCLIYVRGRTYPLGCNIVISVRGQVGLDLYPNSVPIWEYKGTGPYRFYYVPYSQQPYDDCGDRGCECDLTHLNGDHGTECDEWLANDWAKELMELNDQNLESRVLEWLAENCTATDLPDLVEVNAERSVLSL